jgi:hypothetical protein
MADDLARLVRAAYNNALLLKLTPEEAFEKALEMLLRHRPLLPTDEARAEVAKILNDAPAD